MSGERIYEFRDANTSLLKTFKGFSIGIASDGSGIVTIYGRRELVAIVSLAPGQFVTAQEEK